MARKQMHTGHVISGTGHLAVLGWMFFGGFFSSQPDPVQITEVSVISGAEFAALTEGVVQPEVVDEVAQPASPEVTPDAPEVDSAPEEQAAAEAPEPPEPPAEEPAPEEAEAPNVSEAAPELPEPPADVTVDAPEVSERPVERPIDRVAPTPAPAPEEETTPDIVTEPAVAPEETPEQPVEEKPQDAAQTPEAADRVVPETPEPPRAAVTKSLRPPARRPKPPARPAPTQTAQPAEDTTAIDDAVREARDNVPSSADNDVPTGPPMTSGEKDTLRLAVKSCWVVDQGAASARVTVTVGMNMSQDGKVVGDVRLVSSSGGEASAVEVAFQAARRAVLRCQRGGYDLPVEKYGQWKEIEITFNPEKMRIK